MGHVESVRHQLFGPMGTLQPAPSHLPDEELVERFRKTGDMRCFEEFWRRYSKKVHGQCLRFLQNPEAAEDVTASVFLKVMQRIRTDYHEGNFAGWLYTVARHECINYVKQAAVRLRSGEIDELDLSTSEDPAIAADVNDVLSQLTDRQRIALKLLYVSRYSYGEIASLQGWPMQEVKTQVQNGKRMFMLLWNRIARGTGT
jgi:RNA polymerase sigma-70 factor (ECF subfamily)